MSSNRNENQNTPPEPLPDERDQAGNGDSGEEPAADQLGKLSPNTTINPKIKNL